MQYGRSASLSNGVAPTNNLLESMMARVTAALNRRKPGPVSALGFLTGSPLNGNRDVGDNTLPKIVARWHNENFWTPPAMVPMTKLALVQALSMFILDGAIEPSSNDDVIFTHRHYGTYLANVTTNPRHRRTTYTDDALLNVWRLHLGREADNAVFGGKIPMHTPSGPTLPPHRTQRGGRASGIAPVVPPHSHVDSKGAPFLQRTLVTTNPHIQHTGDGNFWADYRKDSPAEMAGKLLATYPVGPDSEQQAGGHAWQSCSPGSETPCPTHTDGSLSALASDLKVTSFDCKSSLDCVKLQAHFLLVSIYLSLVRGTRPVGCTLPEIPDSFTDAAATVPGCLHARAGGERSMDPIVDTYSRRVQLHWDLGLWLANELAVRPETVRPETNPPVAVRTIPPKLDENDRPSVGVRPLDVPQGSVIKVPVGAKQSKLPPTARRKRTGAADAATPDCAILDPRSSLQRDWMAVSSKETFEGFNPGHGTHGKLGGPCDLTLAPEKVDATDPEGDAPSNQAKRIKTQPRRATEEVIVYYFGTPNGDDNGGRPALVIGLSGPGHSTSMADSDSLGSEEEE